MSESKSREQIIQSLSQIIIENRIAMLVSCGSDHVIRSRPMININDRFDGDLLFITDQNCEVCRELESNPRCNVSISEPDSGKFCIHLWNGNGRGEQKKT